MTGAANRKTADCLLISKFADDYSGSNCTAEL